MPGKTLTPYEQVPVTQEDCQCGIRLTSTFANIPVVDWAELITLDLSQFEKPGGKEELVKQLEHAVRHVGEFLPTCSAIHPLKSVRILLRQELQHKSGRGRPSIRLGSRVL